MVGLNHLHSDEPQPNLRRRCSRQQLAKGAAGRRLAVDLGDEVAHAKPIDSCSNATPGIFETAAAGIRRGLIKLRTQCPGTLNFLRGYRPAPRLG